MNWDLIIVKITKAHSKKIIARHLAADPSISIQKAMSLLDNLPVVYRKDLSNAELEEVATQLSKLGVVCQAVESKNPLDKVGKVKMPVEDNVEKYVEQLITSKAPKSSRKISEGKVSKRVYFSGTVAGEKTVEKKKNKLVGIIFVAGLITITVIIFIVDKNGKYKIQSTGPIVSKTGKVQSGREPSSALKKTLGEDHRKQKIDERNKGKSVTPIQKKSSKAYVDSATYSSNDYERAIKFFKIALSFNRYNLNAWQGLLAAYRGARMWKEAENTQKRIKELFGENVFTIEKIVEPYGKLSNYVRNVNGVCRIEYQSQSSKRSILERETFLLIRALIAQENCLTVSLYASTGKGTGMLVRVTADTFPSTVVDYVGKTSITYIE